MGLFGLIKDIALLPVNIVADVTMITPLTRAMNDSEKETPFGTIDRIASIGKNIEDTLK